MEGGSKGGDDELNATPGFSGSKTKERQKQSLLLWMRLELVQSEVREMCHDTWCCPHDDHCCRVPPELIEPFNNRELFSILYSLLFSFSPFSLFLSYFLFYSVLPISYSLFTLFYYLHLSSIPFLSAITGTSSSTNSADWHSVTFSGNCQPRRQRRSSPCGELRTPRKSAAVKGT